VVFIKRALIGLVIGIASITPGVSGGIIAAAVGIYEPAVRAISTFFKNIKKNTLYLMPLGLGAVVGVLAFSNMIKYLYSQYSFEVLYLFFGLVAGSIPSIVNTANEKGFRARFLIPLGLALGIVVTAAAMERLSVGQGVEYSWNFFSAILYGFVLAVGTIIPGISTSFILIYLGSYNELMAAIGSIDIVKLIPVALGFGLGVLPLIKLADLLFTRYRAASYYGVLGFLGGSMLAVFPGFRGGWLLVMDILLLLVGAAASYILLKLKATQRQKTELPKCPES